MRAVVYARYSSDQQRDASIEDQVRLCRELVERRGWTMLHCYSDRAASGASTLRAGYQRLLEDARADQFDVVVAEALDRISRDQEDVAGFYKRMRFTGVAVVTLAEGEIGDLHVGLKGTMNALFLKDLADKTRRGLRGRVETGRSAGGNCYGYRVVHEPGPQGPVRGGRRIDPDEADIVRQIFESYAGGRSPKAIATDLNARCVPGPQGGTWGPSTINGNRGRGTGILNNELYLGRLVWNRLRYVKDPDTGRRVSRMNPENDWIVQDVPDLRIVPDALWQRVKERQGAIVKHGASAGGPAAFWDRRRPRYLFSGLVRCGACGGGYAMVGRTHLGCSTARNKGTCQNRRTVRREALETAILEGLRDQLMDPALFETFCAEFHRELNRLRQGERARLAGDRQDLERVRRRIRQIVDAIAEGAPVRSLKDELIALEAREDALTAALQNAPEPPPILHPNLSLLYRRKVEGLQTALADPASREEAAEAIRALVEAIVLMPSEEGLSIELHGELAGMLRLAGMTKPGALAGLVQQVKLVAGAGFEPATFRL